MRPTIILCAGLWCLLGLPGAFADTGHPAQAGACPLSSAGLRPGDVVFIQADVFWARMASAWSLPRYHHGHVGMVVETAKGLLIVHASGNAVAVNAHVIAEPLESFCQLAIRLDVFRPSDPKAAQRASQEAAAFAEAKLAFDSDFSLASAHKLYCTELIWRALSKGYGYDILPVKSRVASHPAVLLSDLEQSPKLQLVRTAQRRGQSSR